MDKNAVFAALSVEAQNVLPNTYIHDHKRDASCEPFTIQACSDIAEG
jgi:hypothetical protein